MAKAPILRGNHVSLGRRYLPSELSSAGRLQDDIYNAGLRNTLFKRGAMFPHPTLWLYGTHAPYYSLDHSRANFATFQAAGANGSFFDFEVPGGDGHRVMF